MSEKNTLEKALDFVGREARHVITDGLLAQFHNTWSDLVGNTEGSDVQWFAWILYQNDPARHFPTRHEWELTDESTREHYLQMARLCIANLPILTERIASRYRSVTEALRTATKFERDEFNKLNSP